MSAAPGREASLDLRHIFSSPELHAPKYPTTSHTCSAPRADMLPTLFISHGPGPMPLLWKEEQTNSHLIKGLEEILHRAGIDSPHRDIRCILVISAHWEAPSTNQLRISCPREGRYPCLLYDYKGFPESTYSLQYDCPSHLEVAERAQELLDQCGFECQLDQERCLDHGAFVPLSMMLPAAELPVIQLSLPALTGNGALNAQSCLRIGAALAPLRSEGVLLVGSGQATHGRFCTPNHGCEFVSALKRLVTELTGRDRAQQLTKWEDLPYARDAHGREEHLLPLMVVAGASQEDSKGEVLSDEWWGQMAMTNFAFR